MINFALVGQKSFAVAVLDAIVDLGHRGVCVWTPEGDKLAERAAEHGIDRAHTVAQFASRLDMIRPIELIINAHGHEFIPIGIRNRARWGAIGYHPSLLPRHRGRDAIQWTIEMGDSIAGGTVYQMDDGYDTGAIIAQDWCHVDPAWDASALWRESLFGMGVDLLRQTVRQSLWGPEYWPTTPGVAQDERFATYEPLFDAARA